jgi:hypothetical protein
MTSYERLNPLAKEGLMSDEYVREMSERRARHSGVQHDLSQKHETGGPGESAAELSGAASLLSGLRLSGRGNRPVRNNSIQRVQQTHGNRAVQRFLQRMSDTQSEVMPEEELVGRIEARAGSGTPIERDVRARLEASLGTDMSGVRIHTDAEADSLARSVEAAAFTTGQDIYFRSGTYNTGTSEGLRLLAHEATHTVQQGLGGLETQAAGARGTHGGVTLSKRGDPAEVEAEEAAARTLAGERAEVAARPSASVSRFDWSDALSMGLGGAIGQVASPFVGQQAAAPDPNALPAAEKKDEGLWDRLKRGWGSEVKREQKRADEIDKFRHDSIDNTVDWLEAQAHKGNQMGVEATKDIPILGQLAKANAAVSDFGTQALGGFIKGAGTFAGSVAQMAANPIGTAKGLWAMSTHIPGLGLPAKIVDKGIDVATGDKTVGAAFDETLGSKAGADDLNFWKGVGGHFLKPYGEAIDKGKYGEVAGRAIFDIGSLVVGAGEAKASNVGKAAETGDAANAAAKVAEGMQGAKAAPKSVPPPSGVPTVRNPTPIVEPPPSVPPSELVPKPGTIPPPPPSTGAPTLRPPHTEIPQAPPTVPARPPSNMPAGPPTQPEFPTPSQAPNTIPDPVAPPSTNPAPSRPAPSTVPSPPENLPTHHPPSPGDLRNPRIPRQPEAPGWAERLLEEERRLGEKIADAEWFWEEINRMRNL